MKLGDMFHSYSFDAAWTRLVKHYPKMKDSKPGFVKAWDEIQTLNPKVNKKSDIKEIRAIRYYEKDEKKWYVHVNGAGKTEPGWSLMGIDWAELLTYEVNDGDINKLGAINTLAHILWEMTWSGFSTKKVKKFADDLNNKVNKSRK
jgi:hypothetical protein